MFGDQAFKLVTEAKASLNLDIVKPYNDELVRSLILETKQLHSHLCTLLSTLESQSGLVSPSQVSGLQSQLLMLHLIVEYNKRSLLLYHNTRTELITSHLARHSFSLRILFDQHPHLRSCLNSHEHSFLKHYSSLITHTKSYYLHLSPCLQLDISDQQIYEPLPTNLLVTVKVNKDLDQLWLSPSQSAPTTLKKHQTITIPRKDVRPLIARGWVSILDNQS